MVLSYFTYEVPRRRRWKTFFAGLAVDVLGALLLIGMGSELKTRVQLQPTASTNHITLVAPIAAPVTHHTALRSLPVTRQVTARLEAPKPAPSSTIRSEPPRVELPKPEDTQIAASAPPPKPTIGEERKENVFNIPISHAATVPTRPREVQTGGFGDPNGITRRGDRKRQTVTVASVGSFELPSGAGKGNGTSGSNGISGTIRVAGFSEGVASPVPHGRGNSGGVVPSGFGDPVAPGGGSAPQRVQKKTESEPVEIVFKPRPVYTPEARQQRVEGEVLLEVVFGASGSLRINRVVKELGHGLDDAAVAAAQHIRFRPARRDGQPYDCAALVHIVFELPQ